mmetsp:Transcript_46815/g.141810  ORF Transcript_46815/g.141810 Transcript_46815/m.141810 type:complete len:340 (+) Transcript_46815:923-1942(+)
MHGQYHEQRRGDELDHPHGLRPVQNLHLGTRQSPLLPPESVPRIPGDIGSEHSVQALEERGGHDRVREAPDAEGGEGTSLGRVRRRELDGVLERGGRGEEAIVRRVEFAATVGGGGAILLAFLVVEIIVTIILRGGGVGLLLHGEGAVRHAVITLSLHRCDHPSSSTADGKTSLLSLAIAAAPRRAGGGGEAAEARIRPRLQQYSLLPSRYLGGAGGGGFGDGGNFSRTQDAARDASSSSVASRVHSTRSDRLALPSRPPRRSGRNGTRSTGVAPRRRGTRLPRALPSGLGRDGTDAARADAEVVVSARGGRGGRNYGIGVGTAGRANDRRRPDVGLLQ